MPSKSILAFSFSAEDLMLTTPPPGIFGLTGDPSPSSGTHEMKTGGVDILPIQPSPTDKKSEFGISIKHISSTGEPKKP